ncbi:AfsR/SARP family transcriptional regulator [Streptomyces sp. BI20]|uniref:AfsR/SARP family transcriptional regulator n=1 Tax=Streptomyces sp. BI20 TaxID=3403460 RepID=UPI003C72E6BE
MSSETRAGEAAGGGADALRFEVLGAVRAWRGAAAVELGTPQQRAVLVMLLARRGDVVTVEELVDGVWGERAPRSAVATVRSYVYRLRRALGEVIASEGGGYVARVGAGAVDLSVFEGLVTAARVRSGGGQDAGAARCWARAARLWRGPEALVGVPGPFAAVERGRLAEVWLGALVERWECELRLGLHDRVAPEAARWCARFPGNERLRGLWGRAREGAVVGGLGPGAGTPGVGEGGEGARAESGEGAHAPRPAQLPYAPADFTGRASAVEELVAALAPGAVSASAVVVTAVGGMGGVGKTTLAVHAGHRVSAWYPDGQLYVNLRGVREDPAAPEGVLAGFLRSLGVMESGIPESLEERAALFRSRVAGRRLLVVLDDARDAAQVEPLLPGTAGCAVIVTSRGGLPELAGARRLRLEVLPAPEAMELLRGIVGARRLDAEPVAARRLVRACGGLPLALRVAGARLASRPAWSVADFVAMLRERGEGTGGSGVGSVGGEDGVDACFRLSYELLDRVQARLFRLLSVVRVGVVEESGAVAVGGAGRTESVAALERLVELGLLESPAPRVYRFHDLVRAFARARCAREDGDEQRAAAVSRLVDHLLASARNAYRVERPGHPVADALAPTVSPGAPWSGAGVGGRRVVTRHEAVLAVAGQAVECAPGSVDLVADLLLALDPLLDGAFLWADLVPPARRVMRVAAQAGRTRAVGRVGYMLGGALMQLRMLDEADAVLAVAERSARECGDEAVWVETVNCQGLSAAARGDLEGALGCFDRAVAVGERCGSEWGVANLRANRAGVLLRAGRVAEAADEARASLASSRARGDRYGEVHALYKWGQALREWGRFTEAVRVHEEGLRRAVACGNPMFEVLHGLAGVETWVAAGLDSEAVGRAETTLVAARRLGWQVAEVRVLWILAKTYTRTGEAERAREFLREAWELSRSWGSAESEQVRGAWEELSGALGERGVAAG